MSRTCSTRWRPTPQQFMVLEELYRRGLTNPNASQIKQITAHLAFYGQIQGKNVFYWFQNHKARDRMKLRKKLADQLLHQELMPTCPNLNNDYHAQDAACFRDLFRYPPLPLQYLQPNICCSSQNMHHADQGTAVCKIKVPQEETGDLPKDRLIRTYGHDSTMFTHVGPTFSSCKNMNKPLETLELFPLTAPSLTEDQH